MNIEEIFRPYENLYILIPTAIIFLIIFLIVMRTLKEMPLFEGPAKIGIGLGVSVLAVYGMDRAIIRTIVMEYTTMGVVLLIILAGLITTVWITLSVKSLRGRNRYQDQDERSVDE